MKFESLLLTLLLSTARASLLQGLNHKDHLHHHDHHGHHHHHDHHDHHDHSHDDPAHHQEESLLATGDEAALASVRINELVGAFTSDNQQLPKDMPTMNEVPKDVQFSCADRLPGYYADVDYDCQVFHICRIDHPMTSFLCPNGTVFNQRIFTCDWWFNVNCSLSQSFYSLNTNLYKEVEEEQAVVKQEVQLNNDIQAKSTFQASKDTPNFFAASQKVKEEQAVVKQEMQLDSNTQAKSNLHTNKATFDFSSVFQGLSLPDETPDGSEKIEALLLPLTPQFIIPVPPSTQVFQKNLNQLASDYLPPTNEYLPPTNEYLPPKNDYLPPTNEYLPPKNDYLPPTNEYLPPKNDYLPPTNEYLPPSL